MAKPVLPTVQTAASAEQVSRLEIRLFGSMEVRLGAQTALRPRTRKAMWLLALLALRAGRAVERGWLAETLWPDVSTAQARRSLRQCLHDLRLALGPEARRLSGEAPRALRLDAGDVFVDVLAFDAAIAHGGASEWSELARESLEAAVRLYRGPLLEDCAEEWILEERRPREQVYLAALERLAAAATARQE